MESEPSGKSHPIAWVLFLILAVPVLYVLTLPLVVWSVMINGPMGIARPSRALSAYLAPSDLIDHTPLKEPMDAYARWCYNHLPPVPGPH